MTVPTRRKVLIVDDEPDIHAVTRLSLRDLVHGDEPVEFLSAMSGQECVERMREQLKLALDGVDEAVAEKVRWRTAAALYRIDVPAELAGSAGG